jgi:plasmid maintenance system antidote protein VapI
VVNNVGFLMAANNVSKTKLARDLNVSRSTIYNILNGRTPSAKMMLKLSAYFDKSVNEVFCI